jgi:hypothetical protein
MNDLQFNVTEAQMQAALWAAGSALYLVLGVLTAGGVGRLFRLDPRGNSGDDAALFAAALGWPPVVLALCLVWAVCGFAALIMAGVYSVCYLGRGTDAASPLPAAGGEEEQWEEVVSNPATPAPPAGRTLKRLSDFQRHADGSITCTARYDHYDAGGSYIRTTDTPTPRR